MKHTIVPVCDVYTSFLRAGHLSSMLTGHSAVFTKPHEWTRQEIMDDVSNRPQLPHNHAYLNSCSVYTEQKISEQPLTVKNVQYRKEGQKARLK
jgi:hypothetical protein